MTTRSVRMGSAAIVLAAVGACSSVTDLSPGLVLAVTLEGPRTPGVQADGSRIIRTDLGAVVHLTRAYLVSSSVEVFPCEGPLASWTRVFEGRAEAHAQASATRLGTAFAESLTGVPVVRPLGRIGPPPGRYCRVAYTASAADADAADLPADAPVAGNTVYLEGTYVDATGTAGPFRIVSAAPFTVEADLADPGAGARQVRLNIAKDADHWFDGVDFAAAPVIVMRTVLDNLRRSIRLEEP